MIKLTKLNKYFNKGKRNEIHVINDATLELPDSGIVTFFGHSGSGKTTLLNAIGGLDSFKGRIQYDDTVIKNYKMGKIDEWRSKNVGYVFQNYDLLQNESVYDNLAIALSIIGINDKDEVKARIEYALKAVGLFKYRKKKAYALSGGQMQRVAIARALVKKCKILIADEPTGNLDSANTIEVMNILKSISKNTLVLLVTHEKNIADFYSDQIIEMEDGKIVSVRENDSNDAILQEEHSNAVYLGDMDMVEQDGDTISLTIYKEPGDDSKKHIDVFIKNNTLYIRGDTTVRLASDSSLKIIDGKRKTIVKNEESAVTYDNSFYDDTKKGKRGFKALLNSFLTSWVSLFSGNKKRTKFLYASMFMMGLIFAVASVSYVNNTMTDDSQFGYADGYYGVLNLRWGDEDVIYEAYDKGHITNVEMMYGTYLTYQEDITFTEYISSDFNALKLPFDKEKVDIKYGRGVENDGEIVISENLIENLMRDFSTSTTKQSFLGKRINDQYNDKIMTIVGISTNDRNVVYMYSDSIAMERVYTYEGQAAHITKEIEQGHYTVTKGRDVVDDVNVKECLVLDTMVEGMTYYTPDDMQIVVPDGGFVCDGSENVGGYTVVGTFKFDKELYCSDAALLTNQTNLKVTSIGTYFNDYGYDELTSYIVKGSEPKKSNEIVVSAYCEYKIGDKITSNEQEYTVVGLVSGGYYTQTYGPFLDKNIANVNYSITYCLFETNDVKAAKDFFETKGMTFDTTYNIQYKEKVASEASSRAVFLTIFAVCFAIAGLFIFFIMRSRTLADIYTIGVYRSLGSKRAGIVGKYMLESMILTTVFTVTGYIIGCVVYSGLSTLINSVFGTVVAMTSVPVFLLIGLAIFAVSTFIGTLPIMTLFLRTPAQIKAKYDI